MLPDDRIPPFDFRAAAGQAVELVSEYYSQLDTTPLLQVTTAQVVRELLSEPLPEEPVAVSEALATVRDAVYRNCRHNGHPRCFGYVGSPGSPTAAVADLLTAGLNANVASWRGAPAGVAMEHLVLSWLSCMIGYSPSPAGLLLSGGSMANFSALAAARAAAAPEIGKVGLGNPLRVYVSKEGHFSVGKAAMLLGIGSDNVVLIPTDDLFRIDVADLERRINADRAAGYMPMCIVANAGTVNTGAVDCLGEVARIAEIHGVWLHVDASYGGFAALAPSTRHLFAGIERADSVSLDPHKWLNTSLGCGCILYRNSKAAMEAFKFDAEYVRTIGFSGDEAFAFWNLGPELSRPNRALSVWLQIKLWGSRNLTAAIEGNLACARHFASLVAGSGDFQLLAPVTLSVFCFRCRPAGYSGDLDSLNQRILNRLQRGGSSYLSNTRLGDNFAMRGCVVNYRTKIQDMERLFEDVQDAAGAVLAGETPVRPAL